MVDLPPQPINELPVDPAIEAKILSRIVPLPQTQAKARPRFCVDGRTGDRVDSNGVIMAREPYGQALGGDLNIATVRWLLGGGQEDFLQTESRTLQDLRTSGYAQVGVHDGGHAHGDASDCGFADNNARIIEALRTRAPEVWAMIQKAVAPYPDIQLDGQRFINLINQKVAKADLAKLPSGKTMVDHAVTQEKAAIQHLEADHKERYAVVNLRPETTLNTDENQDEAQAFNLDLWLLQQQAHDLGIDVTDATLLTLGLYVATEMILVEAKRGVRLPIMVNK